DIPELVTLTTVPRQQNVETVLFTQCTASWEDSTERQYAATKIVLLYTCPLLFMSIAYCQIVRVLWTSRNIPGHKPAYGTGAPAYLHHQQMSKYCLHLIGIELWGSAKKGNIDPIRSCQPKVLNAPWYVSITTSTFPLSTKPSNPDLNHSIRQLLNRKSKFSTANYIQNDP
ncbi:hypothetical protein AAG570_007313, partial [Ranatra chinensis]